MKLNQDKIINLIQEVLKNTPNEPFLCLQLSSLLYAKLQDDLDLSPKLVAGSLFYKNNCIFAADYSLNEKAVNQKFVVGGWAGHCWVELDDIIFDLSLFRTIYSDKFNKKYKQEIINTYGNGRGCLIVEKNNNPTDFKYNVFEYLEEPIVNGVIKGFIDLLK